MAGTAGQLPEGLWKVLDAPGLFVEGQLCDTVN